MIFHLRRIFHFSQEILCAKCLRLSSAKVGAMVVTSALFFLSLKLKESVENSSYIHYTCISVCFWILHNLSKFTWTRVDQASIQCSPWPPWLSSPPRGKCKGWDRHRNSSFPERVSLDDFQRVSGIATHHSNLFLHPVEVFWLHKSNHLIFSNPNISIRAWSRPFQEDLSEPHYW